MVRKKIDDSLIRVACRLYDAGFTFAEIGGYMNFAKNTVSGWQTHSVWREEKEKIGDEKNEFIKRSSTIVTKLFYFYSQAEQNCKHYDKIVKQLIVKISQIIIKPKLDRDDLRSLKTLSDTLKNIDGLLRENLNFCFELDDIIEYTKQSKAL